MNQSDIMNQLSKDIAECNKGMAEEYEFIGYTELLGIASEEEIRNYPNAEKHQKRLDEFKERFNEP